MSDAVARLARLSHAERARFLARLRAEKLHGRPPTQPTAAALTRATSREGPIPASFAQEQLWFLDQLAPGAATYNIPFSFHLDGWLDVDALAGALATIARRHEILRTTLRIEAGTLVQAIAPEPQANLSTIDLSNYPDPDREAQRRATELARAPFDLRAGPLYRIVLMRLDALSRRHVLVWVASHAVADGWSVGVLFRELTALYRPRADDHILGEGPAISELPLQYADYAIWQRKSLTGARLDRLVAYWRRTVADCPALRMPTDYPRAPAPSFRGATEVFSFPRPLTERLLELSRNVGVTPFMTLLAAYCVLLASYSGQDDIAVGTVVAGRTEPEIEPLIGCFVNALVLRTDLSGNPMFRDLLVRVREVSLGAFAHQDIPFGKLVQELRPARAASYNPLCQTVLTLGNMPLVDAEVRLGPELVVTWAGIPNGTVRFDFELAIDETPDGLSGRFDYNTDLFRAETAADFCEQYQAMLERIVQSPEQRLSRLLSLGKAAWPQPDRAGTAAIPRPPGATATHDRVAPGSPHPGPAKSLADAESMGGAPCTSTEETLVRLWSDALNGISVGIHDDFFELGGYSLLAAQLVTQLRNHFGVNLGLQQFFETCTVAEVAAAIDELRRQPPVDETMLLNLLDQVERMPHDEVAKLLERFGRNGEPAPTGQDA
jgi:hypothetical protein